MPVAMAILLGLATGSPTEEPAVTTAEVTTSKIIEVMEVPADQAKPRRLLGTAGYKPTDTEKKHYEALSFEARTTGSLFKDYHILGHVDETVSWFGVVREDRLVKAAAAGDDGVDRHELLVEHKFFDGFTDTHQQIVAWTGSGDFRAVVPIAQEKLPFETLVLVRAYGTVVEEKDGVPILKVDYLRVWPWRTFAFMGVNKNDRNNPKWREGLSIPEKVYAATPNDLYYERLLGKRSKEDSRDGER